MKKSTLQYFCLILIFLLCAGGLHADRIILKNGRVIDGTLIGQSREFVRVRSNGRVIRIQKRRIRRILYGNFAPKPAAKKAPATKKAPAAPKAPAAKKPEPTAKAEAEKLRIAAEKLRAAEERIRLAEKRIREAEEKIQAATLKARKAEAKRLEATALAREWELKARKGNFAPGSGGYTGPSTFDYFVPGLGQWRKDETLKAGLTAGFFALNAFNLYDANEKWKSERTVYENLNSFGTPSPTATSDPAVAFAYARVFENQQANIDAQYTRTRNAFIGLLLVYAWNYFDLKWLQTARSGVSDKRPAYGRWRVDLMADAGAPVRTGFQQQGGSVRDPAGIRIFFSANIF